MENIDILTVAFVVNKNELMTSTLMEKRVCNVLGRRESQGLKSLLKGRLRLAKGLIDKLKESNLTQTMFHCSCKLMTVSHNVRCNRRMK